MADHMGEKIREYLDGLAVLPSVDDDVALQRAETSVRTSMAADGFSLNDIEQHLGPLRGYIEEEIKRRQD